MSESVRVIHVRELKNFPDAVYIGRRNPTYGLPESPFHNPFKIIEPNDLGLGVSRHAVCLAYRDYLRSSVDGKKVLGMLPTLRGKDLACWCRASNATGRAWKECHADQIIRLLNEHTDAELIAMSESKD